MPLRTTLVIRHCGIECLTVSRKRVAPKLSHLSRSKGFKRTDVALDEVGRIELMLVDQRRHESQEHPFLFRE